MPSADDMRKRVGDALEVALNRAIDAQWTRAKKGVASQRRRRPGASSDEIAKRIVRDFVRDVAAMGGASGAVATLPGPGTGARIAAGLTVETAVLLERATYMALAVALTYGHDLDDMHMRKYAI